MSWWGLSCFSFSFFFWDSDQGSCIFVISCYESLYTVEEFGPWGKID